MKTLRRDWNEFWFGPISSVPLGLFRMVFGALVLSYALLFFPVRYTWFGSRGVLSPTDADAYNGTSSSPFDLGLGAKTHVLSHWNLLSYSASDHWLTLFFVVFLLAGLGVTLGFWTRTSSFVTYLCLLMTHNRAAPIHNSGDTVMLVMLIYLVLSPAGAACSLDRLWRIFRGVEDDQPPTIVPWAQRLMQLQLATVYLCASLSKVTGPQWMDGTAAYYPMHLPESLRFPTWGRDNVIVINLITWGTIAVEMLLATFVWVPRLRLYVLALGVALHLSIEYSMNIPLFSFLMITSYVTFLTGDDIQNFLAWSGRLIRLTPLRVVFDGECDFCRSSLLVVRFLDVYRQITFVNSHDAEALASTGVRFEDAEEAAYAVRPDGKQFAGFDAFRQIAWQLPATVLIAPLLYVPGVPKLGRRAYAWVKDNRSRLPVAPRFQVKPTKTRTPVGV